MPAKKSFGSNLARIALNTGSLAASNSDIIDVITFVESDWGLGQKLFPVQRVILKAHYGIPLDNDPANKFEVTDWRRENPRMMTEAEYLEYLYNDGRSNIKEVVEGQERRNMLLSIGRRSGKSLMSSCIAAYETYKLIKRSNPQKYYGVAASNTIQLVAVATNKEQASLLYKEISSHFKRCTFFKQFTANNTMSYAAFQTPHDITTYGSYAENDKAKASILVTLKAANAGGIRGSGNIVVIMDEVAHFVEKGGGSAEAVYDALNPSLAAFTPKDEKGAPIYGVKNTMSDGRMILITSPLGKQGLFYKMFQLGMANGDGSENMLCIQAPTWEVNPTISANVFKENYSKDPTVFFTEFGGEFTDRTLGWIEDPQDLFGCVDKSLKPRSRSVARRPHFVGFDLGLVGDASAIAIVHNDEEGKIVLDYIDQIKAGEGKFASKERLDFDDVADWIYQLSRRFYFVEGMFDMWNGIPLEQALAKKGLQQLKGEHMTSTKNSEMYQNFKAMMWDNRLKLYDITEEEKNEYRSKGETPPEHAPYLLELLELQATYKSKYVIEVSAPNVAGKHDDYSDALVRAVWLAATNAGKLKHIAGKSTLPGQKHVAHNSQARINSRRKALLGGSDPKRQVPKRRGF
jgi:hypothetical protein